MSRFLFALGQSSFRHRWWVLGAWLAVLIAVAAGFLGFRGQPSDNFTIPGTESQRAVEQLQQNLPAFSGAQTQLTFLWSEWNAAEVIAVLLFIGAMGKSALGSSRFGETSASQCQPSRQRGGAAGGCIPGEPGWPDRDDESRWHNQLGRPGKHHCGRGAESGCRAPRSRARW